MIGYNESILQLNLALYTINIYEWVWSKGQCCLCAPRLHYSCMHRLDINVWVHPSRLNNFISTLRNSNANLTLHRSKLKFVYFFQFRIPNLNLLAVIFNLLCCECVYTCRDTSCVECDWLLCVCVHLEKRQFFVQWVIRLMARVNGADASGTVGNAIIMRYAIKITIMLKWNKRGKVVLFSLIA